MEITYSDTFQLSQHCHYKRGGMKQQIYQSEEMLWMRDRQVARTEVKWNAAALDIKSRWRDQSWIREGRERSQLSRRWLMKVLQLTAPVSPWLGKSNPEVGWLPFISCAKWESKTNLQEKITRALSINFIHHVGQIVSRNQSNHADQIKMQMKIEKSNGTEDSAVPIILL